MDSWKQILSAFTYRRMPCAAEADQGGAFPVNGVLSLWDAKTQAPEEIPGSDIGIGDSIAINTPTSITIVDTDWEPYEGSRTVFLGGALGGCQEHPCELGHSCAYSRDLTYSC